MKQTEAGQSIGIALESNTNNTKIMTFVNLDYWAPSINLIPDTDFESLASGSDESIIKAGNAIFDIKILFSSILNQFKLVGIEFGKNVLKVKKIFTEEIETKKLCLGDTCVTEKELKDILDNKGVSPAETSEPVEEVEVEEVITTTPETEPIPDASISPEPEDNSESQPEETVTPEATPESTPESTPEVAPEPSPSEEPTPEPSPEPTA